VENGDVICCASNSLEMVSVFLKEEEICYQMVYYTLYLS